MFVRFFERLGKHAISREVLKHTETPEFRKVFLSHVINPGAHWLLKAVGWDGVVRHCTLGRGIPGVQVGCMV